MKILPRPTKGPENFSTTSIILFTVNKRPTPIAAANAIPKSILLKTSIIPSPMLFRVSHRPERPSLRPFIRPSIQFFPISMNFVEGELIPRTPFTVSIIVFARSTRTPIMLEIPLPKPDIKPLIISGGMLLNPSTSLLPICFTVDTITSSPLGIKLAADEMLFTRPFTKLLATSELSRVFIQSIAFWNALVIVSAMPSAENPENFKESLSNRLSMVFFTFSIAS